MKYQNQTEKILSEFWIREVPIIYTALKNTLQKSGITLDEEYFINQLNVLREDNRVLNIQTIKPNLFESWFGRGDLK